MDPRARHRERYWNEHDEESYTCPDCGRGKDEVSEFQVHHKDGNPTNGDGENLVALCKECHHDRHGFWTRQYTRVGKYEDRKRAVGRGL